MSSVISCVKWECLEGKQLWRSWLTGMRSHTASFHLKSILVAANGESGVLEEMPKANMEDYWT